MLFRVCKQGPFEKEQLSISLHSIVKIMSPGCRGERLPILHPHLSCSSNAVGCLYTDLNSSAAWSGHLNVMITVGFKR